MNMLLPLLFIFAIFAVPIGLIILVVQMTAKGRREALRGPWMQLAHGIGGQFHEGAGFTGSSIVAQRPTHTVMVKMTLVSVMDAASLPYYPDGGTFTEVILQLHPQHPAMFVPPGAKTQTFVDHTTIPSLAYLGPSAQIFLDTRAARVVLPGACANIQYLGAAVQSLEHMLQLVSHAGPLAAAA